MENNFVNQGNCLSVFLEYVNDNYGNQIEKVLGSDDCPYDTSMLNDELAYKDILFWFAIERTDATGRGLADEFAEKFLKSSPELAAELLGIKNVIKGTFVVLGRDAGTVRLRKEDDSREYAVSYSGDSKIYTAGRVLETRIYKWNGAYRFCGITRARLTDEEIYRRSGFIMPELAMRWYEEGAMKRAESIVLRPYSKLSSILNKYSANWVDGIANALGIDTKLLKGEKIRRIAIVLTSDSICGLRGKLPGESLDILRLVMSNGGFVKYGELKGWKDDTGPSWGEAPPKSPIGMLRLYGLIAVGRMPISSKMYKVAIIPADIRECVRKLIAEG